MSDEKKDFRSAVFHLVDVRRQWDLPCYAHIERVMDEQLEGHPSILSDSVDAFFETLDRVAQKVNA